MFCFFSNIYIYIYTVDGSEIRRSPLEVGFFIPLFAGVFTSQVVTVAGFLPSTIALDQFFLAKTRLSIGRFVCWKVLFQVASLLSSQSGPKIHLNWMAFHTSNSLENPFPSPQMVV